MRARGKARLCSNSGKTLNIALQGANISAEAAPSRVLAYVVVAMHHGRTPPAALRVVKIVHTLAWAFFVGCIVAIPFLACHGRFDSVVVAAAIVVVEIIVLLRTDGAAG